MKNISCKVYQDLLPLYVDGAVSTETKAFVDQHLAACEDCRRELEKLSRPLELPVERDASPFAAIKKQWARKNALIWGLSFALLSIFLLLALPVFDTAMQYHIQQLIGGGAQNLFVLLVPAAAGFALEWWFVHRKKQRWVGLILLVLPALILVWAELAWAAGGWDRFGSSLLWYAGFPLLLGAGLAVLCKAALGQPRWVKRTLAALMALFLLISVALWPRRMADVLDLDPDPTMLAVSTAVEMTPCGIDLDKLLAEIQNARLSPWRTTPELDADRCLLVRLNDAYILAAPYGDTPYIFEYAGALEDFDGQHVRWRIYHYPALYLNLKLASADR